MKQVLSELSIFMKNKSGVESIDVNDYLQKLFTESAYDELLEATKTTGRYSKVDFKRVSQDLGDMKKSMDTLKDQIKNNEDPEYPSTENLDQDKLAKSEKEETKKAKSPITNQASPSSNPLEKPDEIAAEDAEGPDEEPEEKTQDDIVTDISSLENMVADITDELKNSKDKN